MQRSTDHILTTHVGSLPRPPDLIALNRARAAGEKVETSVYEHCLSSAITAVLQKQREIGLDVPDDGEFGKPMTSSYDYGPWYNYAFARLSGFAPADSVPESRRKRSSVANITLTTMLNRRDWQKFKDFYQDPEGYGALAGNPSRRPMRRPVCTSAIKYIGQAAIRSDIANFKQAMGSAGVNEGFMCSIAPGSFARNENLYYETEEDFVVAAAEAMREEYRAIVDAGILLQIDDPGLPDNWDMINPEPPLDEFKKFERVRIEALNHALRGLPPDRIRYHICWGSWHGPHTTDIPLRDIVDLLLSVNAGAYSIEAANARHEHEWRVWHETKLPDGKSLIPGVVSHATNVVEHPQVVADRIVRFARAAGRENVMAGTDCGLGGRLHPQLAWAKLEVLVEGARLATAELWK